MLRSAVPGLGLLEITATARIRAARIMKSVTKVTLPPGLLSKATLNGLSLEQIRKRVDVFEGVGIKPEDACVLALSISFASKVTLTDTARDIVAKLYELGVDVVRVATSQPALLNMDPALLQQRTLVHSVSDRRLHSPQRCTALAGLAESARCWPQAGRGGRAGGHGLPLPSSRVAAPSACVRRPRAARPCCSPVPTADAATNVHTPMALPAASGLDEFKAAGFEASDVTRILTGQPELLAFPIDAEVLRGPTEVYSISCDAKTQAYQQVVRALMLSRQLKCVEGKESSKLMRTANLLNTFVVRMARARSASPNALGFLCHLPVCRGRSPSLRLFLPLPLGAAPSLRPLLSLSLSLSLCSPVSAPPLPSLPSCPPLYLVHTRAVSLRRHMRACVCGLPSASMPSASMQRESEREAGREGEGGGEGVGGVGGVLRFPHPVCPITPRARLLHPTPRTIAKFRPPPLPLPYSPTACGCRPISGAWL